MANVKALKAVVSTEEVSTEEVVGGTSEVESKVIGLTLEQYAQRAKVNPGTIASFKYEATKAGDKLEARTREEWAKALEKQSARQYN